MTDNIAEMQIIGVPVWMRKFNNQLPIEGKKSYVSFRCGQWRCHDQNGTVIMEKSRKNWLWKWIRNNWDVIV